jgi:hypothetical protein
MLTMDINRIWAMELTRDLIKELRDSILLTLQLVIGANRYMDRFFRKNKFFVFLKLNNIINA